MRSTDQGAIILQMLTSSLSVGVLNGLKIYKD